MDRTNAGQDDTWNAMPQHEQGNVSPPTLKEQAADLGRKATQGAKQVASQAQSQAQSKLERGKADAAITLSSVATTLLNSGIQLRDEQQAVAGEYVERAARQIERAAHFVQTADLREVVDQVEDFARRRPAVFIGSAFAAGLLAARFLKSSRNTPRRSADNAPDNYMDREVPAPVADETRRAAPASGAWEEAPL
jgi:ElaB/YqjD/DUF883 family membrane-anchored ribosome-binding protein